MSHAVVIFIPDCENLRFLCAGTVNARQAVGKCNRKGWVSERCCQLICCYRHSQSSPV